jgi:hypothetical protein
VAQGFLHSRGVDNSSGLHLRSQRARG